MAEGAFARIKDYQKTQNERLELGPLWELEEPLLYWDRKEEEKAKFLLRRILDGGEQPSSPLLASLAMSTMGSWLAESNMANPTIISRDYLDKAFSLTNPSNDSVRPSATAADKQSLKRIYVTLAQFADDQYRSIKEHMDSSLYAEKMRVLKEQVSVDV